MTTREHAARQIQSALQQASARGTYVLFRGEYREMPVVEVPIDLPLFRPENGRLITRLHEYLREQGIGEREFSARIDQPWVQEALQQLLLPLSRDPQGSIYEELARQAQQTEPLLLTYDGVVVNGNRRLAAMRALHEQDRERYAAFGQVRATVMPEDATAEDIEYVESALQLAPETKLAYTWINRRLKLRRQREVLKLPVKRILESYRLPDEKSLERELAEIDLAEAYLRDYLGEAEDYPRIEDAELYFVALNEQLAAIEPSRLRALWRWAGFAMIDVREQETKVLDYFPFVPPNPANVPEAAMVNLARSRGLVGETERADSVDSLPFSAMERLMSRRDSARELTQELTDVLEQLRIEANYHEMPRRLLRHVQSARKLAEKLEADRLTAGQKAKIGSELAAIGYHSRRFLEAEEDAPAPISPARRKWRKFREAPQRFCRDSTNPLLRWLGRHWPGG
ncbi:hypothetical protein [Salinicola peritrichatus]|uniref:hypothetical protein n=1 Tax=Salinicola peritrichatus TaxID=1267424 RepID=UPI000DA1E0E0|nr:hypothetical protein [Salinicola peritrichatus]